MANLGSIATSIFSLSLETKGEKRPKWISGRHWFALSCSVGLTCLILFSLSAMSCHVPRIWLSEGPVDLAHIQEGLSRPMTRASYRGCNDAVCIIVVGYAVFPNAWEGGIDRDDNVVPVPACVRLTTTNEIMYVTLCLHVSHQCKNGIFFISPSTGGKDWNLRKSAM